VKPYRPANASEGDWFRARYCDRCAKDVNEDCEILGEALFFDITDKEYPREWIEDEKGPRCTAFEKEAT
jgi:hypothetical protein